MSPLDPREPREVVGQIGERDLRRGARQADGAAPTNPMRRFSAPKICSTLLRTRARVALPRAMCGGSGLPRSLARWNCATNPQRQIGPAATRRVRPDPARRVHRIEHCRESAAVVAGRVRDDSSTTDSMTTQSLRLSPDVELFHLLHRRCPRCRVFIEKPMKMVCVYKFGLNSRIIRS
jgi:hypothetical protein